MDSKTSWKCKHGCANTSSPCQHLEALISPKNQKALRGSSRGVKMLFTDNLERFEKYIIPQQSEEGWLEEMETLKTKLQAFVLTADEEAAILSRLGLGDSFSEIGLKLGCSRQYAWAIYKQAIKKLKKQGYK